MSKDYAVIGSSNCLRFKNYSKMIDLHENVVRVNFAPIEDEFPFCGKKTTEAFIHTGFDCLRYKEHEKEETIAKYIDELKHIPGGLSHEERAEMSQELLKKIREQNYLNFIRKNKDVKIINGSPSNLPIYEKHSQEYTAFLGRDVESYSKTGIILKSPPRGGIRFLHHLIYNDIVPHAYGFDTISINPVYYKPTDVAGQHHAVLSEVYHLRKLQRAGYIKIHRENHFLDCTIRDGGYLNNWSFNTSEVEKAYKAASDAGYDYFEIGYRDNMVKYADKVVGPYKHVTDEMISSLKKSHQYGSMIAIMVNQVDHDLSDFKKASECDLDMVRIAVHKKDLEAACKSVQSFDALGYVTTLNVMAAAKYSDSDIRDLAQLCQVHNVKIVYIADSFGSLSADMILHFKNVFCESVTNSDYIFQFGIHTHSNLGNALDKTTRVMDEITYIDSSIGGMGRGCGNLSSESLMSYMIREKRAVCIDYDQLIETACELTKSTDPLFNASGHYNIHPNFVIKSIECNLSPKHIIDIIKSVNQTEFTIDYFEKLSGISTSTSTGIIDSSESVKVLFCIPARFNSSRLKGKLMMDMNGKSVIQRTYEQVLKADMANTDNVYIISDDTAEFVEHLRNFCPHVVPISTWCNNGTERISAFMNKPPYAEALKYDIVMNVQGDEPYVNPRNINDVLKHHIGSEAVCSIGHYNEDNMELVLDKSTIKSVCDDNNRILYSSRTPIPFNKLDVSDVTFKLFTGIYAYDYNFLKSYDNESVRPLHLHEDIEHLSLIEKGFFVQMVKLTGDVEIGVNTSKDYQYLKEKYRI